MITIDRHSAETADEHRMHVLQVWNRVFGAVEDVAAWRATVWDRHRARPDDRRGWLRARDRFRRCGPG